MTFLKKKNLNACPHFLVVPHQCCINVFFHHSWVQVQPARTKFREAYCLVRSAINWSAINRRIVEYHSVSKYSQHWSSCWAQCVFLVKLTCQLYLQVHYCLVWSAINRSAINRRIVEYHSVSKYSQHCSSCWAQCVFLVKLTCQLYLQVHWNRTSICSQQWFPARRPLSSGRHCAAKNSDTAWKWWQPHPRHSPLKERLLTLTRSQLTPSETILFREPIRAVLAGPD